MTDIEEQQLHELSRDIAGVMQSPWQPRVISQAFASRGLDRITFTMQQWIDLDALQSPLLLGELPSNYEEVAAAFTVFDLDLGEAEEASLICNAMQREIAEAFASSLAMRSEGAQQETESDGFGDFAPILACLITQCGVRLVDALALPVAQAFILIATHRRNAAWRVAGTPYAVRDLHEDTEKTGKAQP